MYHSNESVEDKMNNSNEETKSVEDKINNFEKVDSEKITSNEETGSKEIVKSEEIILGGSESEESTDSGEDIFASPVGSESEESIDSGENIFASPVGSESEESTDSGEDIFASPVGSESEESTDSEECENYRQQIRSYMCFQDTMTDSYPKNYLNDAIRTDDIEEVSIFLQDIKSLENDTIDYMESLNLAILLDRRDIIYEFIQNEGIKDYLSSSTIMRIEQLI